VVLKRQDNRQEINAQTGDVIQIELETMGTAGYGWYFHRLDPEHIELLSEETQAISRDKLGASHISQWKLKMKKRGPAEIQLDHYRPWEGIEKSIDHFRLKINIFVTF